MYPPLPSVRCRDGYKSVFKKRGKSTKGWTAVHTDVAIEASSSLMNSRMESRLMLEHWSTVFQLKIFFHETPCVQTVRGLLVCRCFFITNSTTTIPFATTIAPVLVWKSLLICTKTEYTEYAGVASHAQFNSTWQSGPTDIILWLVVSNCVFINCGFFLTIPQLKSPSSYPIISRDIPSYAVIFVYHPPVSPTISSSTG